MKSFTKSVVALLLTIVSLSAVGQSRSYHALREKFRGEKEVFAFHTSGGFARTILWLAGERDFKDAIKDVKDVRFIVIPKQAFKDNRVTLDGFKKVASRETFEELVRVKDHGDEVSLMMQSSYKGKDNRYLVVIDSTSEVIVMEIEGYIDPTLTVYKEKIAYN